MPSKKAPKSAARSKKNAPSRPRVASTKASRSETLALRSASPSFTVNDLSRSLAFYRDVLGFGVEEEWKDDGKVTGVSLKAGDVSFMIGQDDWKKGRDRSKGQGVRMYCTTRQDIDELANRILKAGWKLTQEPKDQPWGTRDIALDDPDGYHLTLAQQK